MFNNLRAEMVRAGVDVSALSERCGMKVGALYARLNGTTPFSLEEARRIKNALNVDLPIEELFARKDEK